MNTFVVCFVINFFASNYSILERKLINFSTKKKIAKIIHLDYDQFSKKLRAILHQPLLPSYQNFIIEYKFQNISPQKFEIHFAKVLFFFTRNEKFFILHFLKFSSPLSSRLKKKNEIPRYVKYCFRNNESFSSQSEKTQRRLSREDFTRVYKIFSTMLALILNEFRQKFISFPKILSYSFKSFE